MKVIFKQEYFGRDLFILEHKNKLIQVYRSSGLSGTGHEGQIIPFTGINTEIPRFRGQQIGYIWKEMFYNKKFRTHDKEIERFIGLQEKMNFLKEFLKNEETEICTPESEDMGVLVKFIKETSKRMKDVFRNYPDRFDLADEF